MPIYDTGVEREGICKEVVVEIRDKLELLWNRQEETGNETFMGFGRLDGDIFTSDVQEGDRDGIGRMNQIESLSRLPPQVRKGSDLKGVIHTHPVGEDLMNSILSSGDMHNHIVMMDTIRAYRASLVLTKEDDMMVLFGVESPKGVSGLERKIDRMEALKDRMGIDVRQGFGRYDMLNQMAEEMDKIGRPCSHIFEGF